MKEVDRKDSGAVTVTPDDVIGVATHGSQIIDANCLKLIGRQVQALRGVMSLALSARTLAAKNREPVTTLMRISPFDFQD